MSARMRLIGVVLGLLFPTLVVARWSFVVLASEMGEASIALPSELGPWVASGDEELEAWVLEMIEPDAYLMRSYQREGAAPIGLYVGMYARWSGFGRAPHSPQGCYPAAGWEILGRHSVGVPAAGGEPFRAKLLEMQKDGSGQAVLYWFQPFGRWPSDGAVEQFLRVRDSVSGRPQFAFVRLAAPGVDAKDPSSLLELAGLLAPDIRLAVERLRASRSERIAPAQAESRPIDEGSG
jgi:EpsI family protein